MRKVFWESTVSVKSSLVVSLYRRFLLGTPLFNEGRLAGSIVVTTQKVRCQETGAILQSSPGLKSTRDSLFFVHDLDHGATATDPTGPHGNGHLLEVQVTAMQRALKQFLEEDRKRFAGEISVDRIQPANHYTTEEFDPVTLGGYARYLDVIVDAYVTALRKRPQVRLALWTINGSIKSAFEYLSLNANHGDTYGFCHTPGFLQELVEVHSEVLVAINKTIGGSADDHLSVSECFWDYLIPEAPAKRSWNKKLLEEAIKIFDFWRTKVVGLVAQ